MEKATEKEIKKKSMENIGVYRLDDGRFAFMGKIYDNEEELKKGIEETEKMARWLSNSWLYKLFYKRKDKKK